ncbi:MAG: hypothetical protein GY793_07365 [Proteobacteria bacterium]|nr:hypothetical protein [Pseudomonadota bacterium]
MARFTSKINAHPDDVYSWHQEFGSSERLSPPWSNGELLRHEYDNKHTLKFLKTNSGVVLEKAFANPLQKTITLEKIKSDYRKLRHIKNFKHDKQETGKTVINETVSVNIFSSLLPKSIGQFLYNKKLAKEFHFRGKRIENDIQQHAKFKEHKRQNIAILGSTNNIGKQFKPFFTSGKHAVFMCSKKKLYSPINVKGIQIGNKSQANLDKLKSIDSVIFFALDDYRTLKSERKVNAVFREKAAELYEMFRTFKENDQFPKTFIMMSSTCVYSDAQYSTTESDIATPHNKSSEYFLALENIAKKLEKYGTRVVIARTGTFLSASTGLLKDSIVKQKYAMCYQSMPETQFINWTTMDDAIYAVNHILFSYQLKGIVNVCSSMTLKANDLQMLLSKKLNKPFIFRLPEFVFKLFYDNISHEEILQNSSVYPKILKENSFNYKMNNIEDALNWETGNFNNNINNIYEI